MHLHSSVRRNKDRYFFYITLHYIDGVFTDRHDLCVDLHQLLSESKPQELSLFEVQLQPIRLHPSLDSFDALS